MKTIINKLYRFTIPRSYVTLYKIPSLNEQELNYYIRPYCDLVYLLDYKINPMIRHPWKNTWKTMWFKMLRKNKIVWTYESMNNEHHQTINDVHYYWFTSLGFDVCA